MFVEPAEGGAADHELRETPLDPRGDDAVEPDELLEVGVPHIVVQIGLVPDLPVTDVPVEAVVPPLVVVADDVDADVGPLFVIVGRIAVIAFVRVFDAGAEPVDDVGSAAAAVRDVVVGLPEIVAGRIVRVGPGVAEDLLNVDEAHARVVERRIVQPRIGQLHCPVGVVEVAVGGEVRDRRREVRSVYFADGAGFPGKIGVCVYHVTSSFIDSV